MIVSNTSLGNFLVDGAYVDLTAAQPLTPNGPQTGLIAIDGTGNWGLVGVPLPFVDASTGISQFGNDTVSSHSLLREGLNAMPECKQFLGTRATNGADTAATISVVDVSGGIIETLTAVCTGTYPVVGASAYRFDIISGDVAGMSGPVVYRVTQFFPNAPAQSWTVAGTSGSGAYSAAVFHVNFRNAVNGKVPNVAGSTFYSDSSGSSTLPPKTGFLYLATGGNDGSAGITSANLIGTDGMPGTGIYSLRGLVSGGQVIVAALTDLTIGQTLNSFAVQENCIAWLAFPSETPTQTEINDIATNNLVADSLFLASDWDYVYDTIQGQTVLVSPMGKLAGLVAAQPDWQYPGNQAAAINVTATDRISGGISSINGGEQGQREQAGIMYLGYMPQAPRGPALGLPFSMTSTGRLVSDIRMMKAIAFSLQVLLGKYVGGMTNPNNLNSLTFKFVRDAIDGYFQNLMIGQTPQIAAYSNVTDQTNNSTLSIEQGFIISAIAVQTLSAARFILAFVQVGNTVQIVMNTIPGSSN